MIHETILVTGATGFLGRHLAGKLNQLYPGATIVLTSGHGRPDQNILKLDLTDIQQVSAVIGQTRPDIVFHVGGLVDLSRNFDVARKCIDYNFTGTMNLLESLKSRPPRKFIYTSTEEVYGTDDIPFFEDDITVPPSPYAVTKLAGEHMCRIYATEWGLPVVVFRIGTMYGPYQPEHRFIAHSIRKALLHEPIPMNSGLKKRDYIFVGDVADGLVATLKHRLISLFEIINLGSGENLTLKDLIEKIIRISGSSSEIQAGVIPDRISESNEWLMDIQKAKKLLQWVPVTDLDTGLTATIEHYRHAL